VVNIWSWKKIYAWDKPRRSEGFRPSKRELITATQGGREGPTFGSVPLAQGTLRNSGKLDHLSKREKQVLLPVIKEYLDLFCNENTEVLPTTTKGCHEIRTGDALLIKKNP
jgi:hypothetical protein